MEFKGDLLRLVHILQEEVDVTVIICHLTGMELLERCLDSIRYSEHIKYEIILVSSIPSINVGEDVLVIHSTEGPAYKRNLASRFARGEYLVFFDDDVEISPYCLYHLWEFMETHPKCGMGFAKILNMERRDVFDDCGSWLTGTGFLYARSGNGRVDGGQFDKPLQILASKSATCITRRDLFISTGGFNADYFILGEETDLSWRYWLKGQEIWYIPQAVSWHAFNTKFKPKSKHYTNERIHFHGCKNYINLLLTNLGAWRLLCTLPIHISIWLVSAVGFLLTGRLMRSWHILRGIFWNLKPINLRRILQKRRRVQGSRVISDKDLFRIVMHNPPVTYYLGRMARYLSQGLHG